MAGILHSLLRFPFIPAFFFSFSLLLYSSFISPIAQLSSITNKHSSFYVQWFIHFVSILFHFYLSIRPVFSCSLFFYLLLYLNFLYVAQKVDEKLSSSLPTRLQAASHPRRSTINKDLRFLPPDPVTSTWVLGRWWSCLRLKTWNAFRWDWPSERKKISVPSGWMFHFWQENMITNLIWRMKV